MTKRTSLTKITFFALLFAIASGSYLFAQTKPAPAYVVKVITSKKDSIYKKGETVSFNVKVFHNDEQLKTGSVNWKITKDGFEPALKSGTSELVNGELTLSGSLNDAGFLQCRVDFSDPDIKKIYTGRGSAGIAPLEIKPSLPVPADFKAYWDGQKKRLAEIPMNIKITLVKSPLSGVECFDIQADGYTGKMSAYLARPINAQKGSLPAILLTHGAGVINSRLSEAAKWAKEGFIALDFNAHGLPNDWTREQYRELDKGTLRQYYFKNRDNRDSIFFQKLYMRMMRALDVLTSQPEWDKKVLVVNGRSQGGGQSIVAAGLDPRVTFFAAQIPAMCDNTGVSVGRINGWPKLVPIDKQGKADENILQISRYYDAMNFATLTNAQAFLTVGFIDVSCPPTTVYATYNNIKGKKQIINHPQMGHAGSREDDALIKTTILEHVASMKK